MNIINGDADSLIATLVEFWYFLFFIIFFGNEQ